MEETANSNVGFPGASTMPQQSTSSAPKKNWKWLIVLILFLIVIGGVTFFVFQSSRTASDIEESPTPDTSSLTNIATPSPTQTPEESSEPVDKAQIKIQVLNGTGIAGEAGILSDALEELGYTEVTTGNASDDSATDTLVTFGSGVGNATVSEITKELNGMYTSVKTNTGDTGDYDIQITTGTRKGSTTAPASTDEPAATATPA